MVSSVKTNQYTLVPLMQLIFAKSLVITQDPKESFVYKFLDFGQYTRNYEKNSR